MAPQTPKQPGKTDLADSGQRGLDESRARSNGDASTAAAGAGAQATDTPADGDDTDSLEKGRYNIGR